nr:HAD hydrolase family protein [Carnobacterium viridans]
MYKLIFFDIDGTLLTDKKRIPDSARQAIQDLKKRVSYRLLLLEERHLELTKF